MRPGPGHVLQGATVLEAPSGWVDPGAWADRCPIPSGRGWHWGAKRQGQGSTGRSRCGGEAPQAGQPGLALGKVAARREWEPHGKQGLP